MSWFQLDSNSVAGRVRAGGVPPEIPCLGTSLQRGILGFTILSIAGFAPWAIGGRWLHQHVGEIGLYCACAAAFIGLSGPLMHRLILGPGSLIRFYKLFGLAFAANSVLWIAGWMALRGTAGSVVGLLAGTGAMGWVLARAFDAQNATVKIVAALFLLNSLGYFVGGWVEGAVIGAKSVTVFGSTLDRYVQAALAKLLWGLCYGVGFGAGLGLAFHLCQARTRAELRIGQAPEPPQRQA
jgi:hypothetical protein